MDKARPVLWKYNSLKDGTHPVKIEYYTTVRGVRKRRQRNIGIYINEKSWSGKYPNWVKSSDPLYRRKNQIIQEELNKAQDQKSVKPLSFYEYFENYTKLKNDVGEIRKRTYRQTLEKIELYEKLYDYSITFESLNDTFIVGFRQYLEHQGYHNNTIVKFIKVIKQVLRKSYNKGLHENRDFQDELWTTKELPSDEIYLTSNDVKAIGATYVLPHLEKIRDLFVIGCKTGLRYEDLCSLDERSIVEHRGMQVISHVQMKTGTEVVIPISPVVSRLLKKYNGFPPSISNQKFNQHIKDVAKLAKIKEWKRVTSHTMRRSFATNAYLAEIPSIDIMKITGHKSESSFLRYIKVSKKETAFRLSEHRFFK